MKPCPIDVLEASAAASGDGEADWAGTSDCDTCHELFVNNHYLNLYSNLQQYYIIDI